jgi:hypothetical protein
LIYTTPLHVYIGTSWGFIFITDVKYLKPLTILQPFQDDIRSFWMFRSYPNDAANLTSRRSSLAGSEVDKGDEQRDMCTPSPSTNPGSSRKKGESADAPDSDTSAAVLSNIDDIDDDLHHLVIVLGKGFSSIIQQNANINVVDDQRRKRVFGILWKINSNSWN